MHYYFELNPIITFGNRLNEVVNIESRIYTSIWAIVELISELSEDTFSVNQGRLKIIMNSGINIDWEDIATIFYSSFGLKQNNIDVKIEGQRLVNDIVNSKSIDDLKSNYPISFYGVSIFRELRTESRNRVFQINEMMRNTSKNIVDERMKNYDFKGTYLKGIAEFLSKDTGDSVEEILLKYTGKMDYFIKGLYNSMINMIEMDKNDEADLLHLYYIKNDNTYIVSNDCIYDRIGFKTLKVHEFKNKIGWEL